MPINKDLWKNTYITKKNCPPWLCPSCNKGILTIKEEDLLFVQTIESTASRKDPAWDIDWIRYRFSAILRCNNSKCQDIVTTLGTGHVDETYDTNRLGEPFHEYTEEFTPIFFSPPIHIFSIPSGCPREIEKEVKASFSLFFCDTNSCANKIRTVIELIMDDLKIPKVKIIKSKRKRLSLHERIITFGIKKPKITNGLLAIKWIGNFGSHTDVLEKLDLIDAYEILEYTLEELYQKRSQEIEKIVKEINKRKSPRSKNRKKSN